MESGVLGVLLPLTPTPQPQLVCGHSLGWGGLVCTLSIADPLGEQDSGRGFGRLCVPSHPLPGAAPEEAQEPGTPGQGFPGQGRRQLVGAAAGSLGSCPSCAISEGCDQGEGSVLPAAARAGGGRGSCLEGPQPQGQGDRRTCQTRERRLSDIFWGRMMMPAKITLQGGVKVPRGGLEAGVRWAGIAYIRTKPASLRTALAHISSVRG